MHKNQLKWIKGLNRRTKTIKLLEDNIQNKFLNIGLGMTFGFDTKSKGNEAKRDKCNFIKLKRFYTAKESIRKKKGKTSLE